MIEDRTGTLTSEFLESLHKEIKAIMIDPVVDFTMFLTPDLYLTPDYHPTFATPESFIKASQIVDEANEAFIDYHVQRYVEGH